MKPFHLLPLALLAFAQQQRAGSIKVNFYAQ